VQTVGDDRRVRLFRHAVPPEVAAQVQDRALAAAEAVDGTWLIGTRNGLVLIASAAGGPRPVETWIPWERLEGADWNRDESRLRFTEIGRYGEPRPSYVFAMPDVEPAALLQLIRERVTASVVLQRGALVSGKRGLKVIGRRPPTGGPITWMYEYDEGVDPDDPAVVEAAEALLQRAREDVGESGEPI
jgi:hypothetical protein